MKRWISKSRSPYRSHRYAVTAVFGVAGSCIWPTPSIKSDVPRQSLRRSTRAPPVAAAWVAGDGRCLCPRRLADEVSLKTASNPAEMLASPGIDFGVTYVA